MNKWLLLLLAVAASLFASCSHSDKPATEPAAEESKKPKTIEISEEARKKSGITIEAAGPAVLKRTLKLNGKIGASLREREGPIHEDRSRATLGHATDATTSERSGRASNAHGPPRRGARRAHARAPPRRAAAPDGRRPPPGRPGSPSAPPPAWWPRER